MAEDGILVVVMFLVAAVLLTLAFGFWAVIFIIWIADGIEQLRQRVVRWIVHRRDKRA